MIEGLLLGALLGFGTFLIGRSLFPAAPDVGRDIAALHRPRWDERRTTQTAVGRLATAVMRLPGSDRSAAARDLAVVGRTVERHAVEKLSMSVLGASLPLLVAIVMGVSGAGLPPGLVMLAMGAGAIGGWFYADIDLRSDAEARRRDFRHALGVYLDLVNVLLAGGSGVEGALDDAARVGDGWAFAQIRQALSSARLNRESPWTTFDRLSDQIGVTELTELSSSIALAGDSGARVRESLAAKAVSMRDHELTRAQAEAEAASERMSVPLVAMATGFILLIGYPAIAQVLAL